VWKELEEYLDDMEDDVDKVSAGLETNKLMTKLFSSLELPDDCPTLLEVGVKLLPYTGPGYRNFCGELKRRVSESLSEDSPPCKKAYASLDEESQKILEESLRWHNPKCL
jgi:hypothetical protein